MADVTLRDLLTRRDHLSGERQRRENELEMATQAEAHWQAKYERAKAEQYLRADGPVKEREARATLATIKEFTELQQAIALRRSAGGALRTLEKDFDSITAAIHALNRQMKVELDLAGRAT